MDTLLSILAGLGGALVVGVQVWSMVEMKRAERKNKRLHTFSVEELKALATSIPLLHCNSVLRELQSREEDYSFALPLLVKLALQRNMAGRMVGWGGLQMYFADKLPDFDFSKPKPSAEERVWLQTILEASSVRKGDT